MLRDDFKLVVEDSVEAKVSGDLESYSDVEMYFRTVLSDRQSEVIFDNFHSSTNIQLLNFQDINNIIVEDSSFSSIVEFEAVEHSRRTDCLLGSAGQELRRVNCSKQDLFYNSLPAQLSSSEPLTQNPAFIVPIVILCAMVIIIVAVVFFIKIKR